MKLTKSKLKLIIKEEMERMELQDLQPQVDAIYNILQAEMEKVPQEVRGIVLQAVAAKMGESSKDSQQLEESEENNPWAICTASVGREDKEKYEKCVKSVKKQNGGS
jgi:hypothetical protein